MTLPETSSLYVAGHQGMVGSALMRQLRAQGHDHLITRTHAELDLTDQAAVRQFFATHKIDTVYLAAAKVGGIHANNTYPAEYIYQNLMIEANVIHEAWRHGVTRLLMLGSSCIYPKLAPQPIAEEALLTGAIEPTNEPYAIAKIAGFKLCESYSRQYDVDFRTVMPTSLYGLGDNYHPENSHVIPALLRRFQEAKLARRDQVVIWGTGSPRREFLYVDDMAQAGIFVMQLDRATYASMTKPMQSHINIGSGHEISIADLARMIARIVGYSGSIVFDTSKPDGAPRKLLEASKMAALGWRPSVALEEGLQRAYDEFLAMAA